MNKLIYLALICITVATACKEKKPDKLFQLEKIDWILGEWYGVDPRNNRIEEKWKFMSDTLYGGLSHTYIGEDTISIETMYFTEYMNHVSFSGTVKARMHEMPIPFISTTITDSLIVFRNEYNNDFPKLIVYHMINRDSMVVSILGKEMDKPKKHDYPMWRVDKGSNL